jgi:hypothetical protein
VVGLAALGCSGKTNFHPLPSQVDILESHRSQQSTDVDAVSTENAVGDLEGKIDESLAALYTLFERQDELYDRIDELERRSGVTSGDTREEMSDVDAAIRATERSLTRTLERDRPGLAWAVALEGQTMIVATEACVDAWQTPSTELAPLFCVPAGTAVFRCESFDRAWTRGLVYHRGVVHEVYMHADALQQLETNRTDLSR